MIALVLAKLHTVSHLSHSRPRQWSQWTLPPLLTLLFVIETRLKKLFVFLIPVARCRESFSPSGLWCLSLKAGSFASSEINLWWICISRYNDLSHAMDPFCFIFFLTGSSTSSRSNSIKSRNSLSRSSTGDSLFGNLDQELFKKLQSLDEEKTNNLSTIEEE